MGQEINIDRLWKTIQSLGEIGTATDGGLLREDGTKEDKKARDLVVSWFEDAGLDIRLDPIGNIIARREGRLDIDPVITGSHIDTPPNGGKFDGTVGVLTPLEIIRTWNENDLSTDRPIEIVVFTCEELSRFGTGMIGSQAAAGKLTYDEALQISDENDITLREALDNINYRGESSLDLENSRAFLEMHIEQGPVLDNYDIPLGIVESIIGISGHQITFTGETDHAGGTPMNLRRDAFMGAAEFALEIERNAREIASETNAVSTVGKVKVTPNGTNVVPGEVELGVDIRDSDPESFKELLDTARNVSETIAERRDLKTSWTTEYKIPPTPMESNIIELLNNKCETAGWEYQHMPSGGGHDAMNIASIAPTGMLFVPSKDGISHNPDEYTSAEDINAGADVLERSLRSLAKGHC